MCPQPVLGPPPPSPPLSQPVTPSAVPSPDPHTPSPPPASPGVPAHPGALTAQGARTGPSSGPEPQGPSRQNFLPVPQWLAPSPAAQPRSRPLREVTGPRAQRRSCVPCRNPCPSSTSSPGSGKPVAVPSWSQSATSQRAWTLPSPEHGPQRKTGSQGGAGAGPGETLKVLLKPDCEPCQPVFGAGPGSGTSRSGASGSLHPGWPWLGQLCSERDGRLLDAACFRPCPSPPRWGFVLCPEARAHCCPHLLRDRQLDTRPVGRGRARQDGSSGRPMDRNDVPTREVSLQPPLLSLPQQPAGGSFRGTALGAGHTPKEVTLRRTCCLRETDVGPVRHHGSPRLSLSLTGSQPTVVLAACWAAGQGNLRAELTLRVRSRGCPALLPSPFPSRPP